MIIGSNNFTEEIEDICRHRRVEYVDAIIFWCERNSVEVELAAQWVRKTPTLKSKVQLEAEKLKNLKQ